MINCEAKRNAERKEYNSILKCMKKYRRSYNAMGDG
jgi:hypothetical protein